MDCNCLSYWFPKLHAYGIRMPATEVFALSDVAERKILRIGCDEGGSSAEGMKALVDDFLAEPSVIPFVNAVRTLGERHGWPLFLRSGHTSGKHDWDATCCLRKPEDLVKHMAGIVMYGELASMIGMPVKVWAIRQMLKTTPVFHAFQSGRKGAAGGMPVVREYRFFVKGREIVCEHPYWPKKAIIRPSTADWEAALDSISGEPPEEARELARQAGAALWDPDRDGFAQWSVDVLLAEDGWYVTDCAVAAQSWHWPDCKNSPHGEEM